MPYEMISLAQVTKLEGKQASLEQVKKTGLVLSFKSYEKKYQTSINKSLNKEKKIGTFCSFNFLCNIFSVLDLFLILGLFNGMSKLLCKVSYEVCIYSHEVSIMTNLNVLLGILNFLVRIRISINLKYDHFTYLPN